MAERGGMLFGEGPTACPFVALDSDRDRRADEPDHRHRCYAEPEPAPRAIAHQRAYCLSAAFPSCPIFQDWAVRAAARPVPMHPGAVPHDADEPMAVPAWAAPPPWVADDAGPDGPEQLGAFDAAPSREAATEAVELPALADAADMPTPPPPPAPFPPPRPATQASSEPVSIERVPSLPVDRTGDAERDAELEAQRQRRMLEERERRAEEERRRRADEERRERERQAAAAAAVPPFLAGRADPPGPVPERVTPPSRPQAPVAPVGAQAAAGPQQARRSPKEEWSARREDLVPVWEREPIQAYPTMRRRIGLGGSGDPISTLTTLLAVLAGIALVVFVIIALPSFLGGGGTPGRTTAPGGVVSPSAPNGTGQPPATPTAAPTEVPQATPRTYTIQAGDSLFAVAIRFGVTIDQLLAANPDIVNADYVTIGQVIVIPDPVPSTPAAPATSAP